MKLGFGFSATHLSPDQHTLIATRAHRSRGDIVQMTTLAASGHPGGSMSSIDFYTMLYACAHVDPAQPQRTDRDRIVVSHGHTSPGVYSALIQAGFLNRQDVLAGFRQAWSPFEGHIEREVPGVEWSTGNLGQGLSAGCGMALAARVTGQDFRVWVCMGDGEQQKGQISEARRFASKYKLTQLAVIVDYNKLQISGDIEQVMPQNLRAGWESDGWEVLEVDGHDLPALYAALRHATLATERPVCVLARTVMGKGVPAIENNAKYHGTPLTDAQCRDALKVLDLPDELEALRALRPEVKARVKPAHIPRFAPVIETGTPRTYGPEVKTDNRSAWGTALAELGALNSGKAGRTPIVCLDCDLAESVKTGPFAHACPSVFFQAGIQEHHTATMAGALSTQDVVTFWSDFGVFGVDEAYNQQRLNDINHAHLKTVCTHVGLDVGEDGKTHQNIDYIGLARNLFGVQVYLPADPNETDRIIRYVAQKPGNDLVCMGRSKLPVITREDGTPAFAGDFQFAEGQAVTLREGQQAVLFATGTMTHRAVQAWELLKAQGISVRVQHIATPLSLNLEALRAAAATGWIFTYEDHHVRTGLGASVAEALVEQGLSARLLRFGVEKYQPSGAADAVFAAAGLDAKTVAQRIQAALVG